MRSGARLTIAAGAVTAKPPRPLTIAVVIPVLHEPLIGAALERVCAQAPEQVVVVEAGDRVTHMALREWLSARTLSAPHVSVIGAAQGRASQMNAGARAARADILVFVHADTALPDGAFARVRDAVAGGAVWGRFDVRLSGTNPAFRVIERFMNSRSSITGIATGDQAIFVGREAFIRLGGFAPIELMEDVDLSKRLKRMARPCRIRTPVITSSRRWERGGIARTVLRMWLLRALYALGTSPRRLAQWYK